MSKEEIMSEKNSETPYLTYFKISGLHGDRDVVMEFNKKTKILLSENGSGKTTAMNLLIGVLSGRVRKINSYDFNSIEVRFRSGDSLSISRADLLLIANESEGGVDPRMLEVKNSISPSEFQELIGLSEYTYEAGCVH
jgi:predicted ATP-binding protein involved in virulence